MSSNENNDLLYNSTEKHALKEIEKTVNNSDHNETKNNMDENEENDNASGNKQQNDSILE